MILLSAAIPDTARNVILPTPTVAPIPEQDRVPLDVLTNPAATTVIRGATLTFPPNSARVRPVPQAEAWSNWGHAFWETWPIESWIAPTMDHMVANGANVVAFKGGSTVAFRGYVSWDEYLARWVDTINYAKSIGLRCFVCYGDGGTYPGSVIPGWDYTVPTATQKALIGEWAQAIASTGNVIGVDVINEVWIGTHTDAALAGYIDAVKAAGLPATYDYYLGGQPELPNNSFGPLVESRLDFLSFHRYEDCTTNLISAWRTANPDIGPLRAVFGEYGHNTDASTAARQSRYSTMKDLIEADPTIAGSLAFAWTDFVDHANPSAPDEETIPYWGMHSVNPDRTLTPRSDVVDIWKTWPTAR